MTKGVFVNISNLHNMVGDELGVIISQIRKYLSTAFNTAKSLCLFNSLCYLVEGAKGFLRCEMKYDVLDLTIIRLLCKIRHKFQNSYLK